MMKKVPALCRHYSVEPGDYFSLALALAVAHVPGFSMAKAPPGAKTKWSHFDTALLRFHLDALKERHPTWSDDKAAASIAKEGVWAVKLRKTGTNPATTLRRRAHMADARWVKMLHNLYHYEVEIKNPVNPPTVEAFVRNYLRME
jgi:hypothetical protein